MSKERKHRKAIYHLQKAQEFLCKIGLEAEADSLYEIEKKVK